MIACEPRANAAVVSIAVPLVSVAVPSAAVPSMKVTDPVVVLGVTDAVNVTAAPDADGFALEVRLVVVVMVFTVCVSVGDVLAAKLEEPPYAALIAWDPTASDDVVKVAIPPASVTVPSVVVPSRNVTLPLAELGLTVAVKVTELP